MPSLKMLMIQETGINDRAVPTLARLQSLTLLNVLETRITAEGLRTLRKALPKCNVVK